MTWGVCKVRLVVVFLALSVGLFHLAAGALASDTKTITALKVDAPPTIDGSLDDACWRGAEKGGGMILRSIGSLATQQTDFYVCYDEEKLYIGLYCHDSQPDKVVATQNERDGSFGNDDYVCVSLDTYHLHRTCDDFYVNAMGTQSDERQRGTASKVSWKGDWRAAAKRVGDGWTAEMEIPFSILNYSSGGTSMGLNVHRAERRLAEDSDWTYLDNSHQLMRFGDVEGLALPPPARPPLQIMPYVLHDYGQGGGTGRMGVDIKKQFGDDSTALFTAFPDFGTIENAVESIDFSYTARRYSDHRPFFQEASSVFSSPYVYTTDIPDFDYGAKVFGQSGKLGYGLMRCTSIGKRADSIFTASYDLPALSTAKVMMITRNDDTVDNKVVSLRLGGQPIPSTSWWMRGGRSLTAGAANDGTEFACGFESAFSRLYFDGSFSRVSKFFNPASGYVDYPGALSYDGGLGYEVLQPGKRLRSYSFDSGFSRLWDAAHGLIEQSADFGMDFAFANHTSLSVSHSWGPHIANYEADPGTPYLWNSDSSNYLSYGFNTADQYRSGGISYDWGRVGGGPSQSVGFDCGFRPLKRLSNSLSLQRVRRNNPEEGKVQEWLGILGAKYEVTAEKSISARLLRQQQGLNLTLSYRQQVRKGLDIFALFGDYNADHTINKFAIKFVTTQ